MIWQQDKASVQRCAERLLRLSSTASRVQSRGGGRVGCSTEIRPARQQSTFARATRLRHWSAPRRVVAERLEHLRGQSASFCAVAFLLLVAVLRLRAAEDAGNCAWAPVTGTRATENAIRMMSAARMIVALWKVAAARGGGQVTATSYWCRGAAMPCTGRVEMLNRLP